MEILITICARGGSKGIPGKNIKLLNGIPLIAYTIQIAKRFAEKHTAVIGISTDDLEIKRVAEESGISTDYLRPVHLATDRAGKIDTIVDVMHYYETKFDKTFDYVLDLDVTSPLRTLEDLEHAFEQLKLDTQAMNLFSVNHAARNPYFNMVEKKDSGYYGLVKNEEVVLSRQTAPQVYDLNASFYFYKSEFFKKDYKTVFTEKTLIYLTPHLCFDLDHLIDFEFLDFLLSENKLEFQIWM
ncbi:acylneuraminate cytidylyltransferase family protein [Pedobacter panaciterrae]|uniref:acylneuraminate cytidylyltransferase family protein n=1 Tax=Pedobacter panaciterrae TaxID=363849 RepID=UPI00155DD3FF|nr:acylneuraminate cytidylyltransferase family protein [Pedobacter panaciterrae]NQX55252.1 acylneuraminate cytidylyltransferase family protein [Pedobacter panaciterrae]